MNTRTAQVTFENMNPETTQNSVHVDTVYWEISSERKRGFFRLAKEITGY